MTTDIENNMYTKRPNKWLFISFLIVVCIIPTTGAVVGILYGTGVIGRLNNVDSTYTSSGNITNIFYPSDNTNDIIPIINDIYNATLMWNDEFEGSALDSSRWNTNIDPRTYKKKNTQQVYTSEENNVRVFNGNLELTARNNTGNITSGWVDSSNKFDFFPNITDGITSILVETRILLPHPGQGFWPCFWLNPSNITRYGDSPSSGEMDLMETINDFSFLLPVIHYGGNTKETGGKKWSKLKSSSESWADKYHVYSLLWEVDTITMFIDGEEVLRVLSASIDPSGWYTTYPGAGKNAPFDAPFYIIMNFAVGGGWAGDTDDTTLFPATMFIDYVRVFYTSDNF
ncbi:(1-3)-beta-glucanase [Paramecium bursaria Chlorella virus CVR-1]|uniref:(1-3)-beta-glucanase n=1 Tax=Paramecium bursaria Chlorella virus CVA-1 TaxID=42683 RepID=M1HL44_9PHYC|nr:(1-3)-beta-glucanase [Paramecium bursaria Chlorella virus CVA-1]AGE50411.1 (1-3)-beta-glucanase [Paramecium bursaria Chlorella virus CVA-1]AGE52088.1 (1-3)-beta-glucanase [Paramecium bursaria Chlorella virus CVR-1]